jgi:hypothetical protein
MNPIIINEKNFARFSKRLQKLIAEKTQNQYTPGLMESQEFLSQVFGVQSLHEMKKMLSELELELELSQQASKKNVDYRIPIPDSDETGSDPFQSPNQPKTFKRSVLNLEDQKQILAQRDQELEQWLAEQKKWITVQKNTDGYNLSDTAFRKETIFFQEIHQAYAQSAHGISINDKSQLKNLFSDLDRNNVNDTWQETGYVLNNTWEKTGYILGCFLQAIVSDEIVDISMPFDWIPMPIDSSDANGNYDVVEEKHRPLTSHDLKMVIGNYQTYLEEKGLSNAAIEVRPYYKLIKNNTHPQVFQMVEMVSDNQKKLKIK